MEDNARTLLLLLDKYFHHQYAGVFFALLAATFLSYRMSLGPSWTKKKRFQTNTPMGESCLCAIVSGCSSGIGLATVRELLAKTNLKVIGIDVARVGDLCCARHWRRPCPCGARCVLFLARIASQRMASSDPSGTGLALAPLQISWMGS